MMQCENCEHEFENENCTNCANGLPCSAYECAKTQGRLKEYCHERAEEIHNRYYQQGRADAIDDFVEAIKEECGYDEEIIDDCYFEIAKETLLRIAEKLKGGVNNG